MGFCSTSGCINVGVFFQLATTYTEHDIGYLSPTVAAPLQGSEHVSAQWLAFRKHLSQAFSCPACLHSSPIASPPWNPLHAHAYSFGLALPPSVQGPSPHVVLIGLLVFFAYPSNSQSNPLSSKRGQLFEPFGRMEDGKLRSRVETRGGTACACFHGPLQSDHPADLPSCFPLGQAFERLRIRC